MRKKIISYLEKSGKGGTLEIIIRGNFKSHSKNDKDAIRKEL